MDELTGFLKARMAAHYEEHGYPVQGPFAGLSLMTPDFKRSAPRIPLQDYEPPTDGTIEDDYLSPLRHRTG